MHWLDTVIVTSIPDLAIVADYYPCVCVMKCFALRGLAYKEMTMKKAVTFTSSKSAMSAGMSAETRSRFVTIPDE